MSYLAQLEHALVTRTGIAPDQWHRVLERMEADGGRARLTVEKVDEIAAVVDSPEALSGLFETMLQLHREDSRVADAWAELKQNAEASAFTVDGWGRALERLRHWLESAGKQATARDQLQYIICAAESAEAQAGRSLSDTVAHFLDTWGMDAAR